MIIVRGTPIDSTSKRVEEPATMTLKLGMTSDHLRSHEVRCDNEPLDSELPSPIKVTEIRISGHFGMSDA